MDSFYNKTGASVFLESIVTEWDNVPEASAPNLFSVELQRFDVQKVDNPHSFRLFAKGEDDPSEIVFRLQGILGTVDLPPLRNVILKRVPHIQAEVGVIGFESKTFSDCMDKMHELSFLLSSATPPGTMSPWKFDRFDDQTEIRLACRYFTTGNDAQNCEHVDFAQGVDPQGVLARLINSRVQHGPDNHVEYSKLVIDGDDRTRSYEITNPTSFRSGDAVEVEFSVVVFPIKGGRFKLCTVLRGLTLINESFTKTAALARAKALAEGTRPMALKRKMGYSAEDTQIGMARREVAKLNMQGRHMETSE